MKLLGKEESDESIINHVISYKKEIESDYNTRFYKTQKILKELISNKSENTVLDYGCGWGNYSVALDNLGYKVNAIDLSENEIDICKLVWAEKHPSINFSTDKIFDFENNSFDTILSSQVIEHVHNVGNYLEQINRTLKTNGKLIISLPNILTPRFMLAPLAGKNRVEKNVKRRNKEILNNYQKGNDHINAWDPFHFSALLATLGFEVEKYIPMEGLAMPRHKPFSPYWRGIISKFKCFESYSYTMLFVCKKVNNCNINNYD